MNYFMVAHTIAVPYLLFSFSFLSVPLLELSNAVSLCWYLCVFHYCVFWFSMCYDPPHVLVIFPIFLCDKLLFIIWLILLIV